MKDLDAILAELRRLQPDLKARYPIREIGVFGSYARSEQRADSDLDLIVDLGPGLTLIDLARLEADLSDRLGLTVEVAIKDALKPRVGKRILAEAVTVRHATRFSTWTTCSITPGRRTASSKA